MVNLKEKSMAEAQEVVEEKEESMAEAMRRLMRRRAWLKLEI